MFFGPIGKTRWPPWPLIGWDIFDFFSETAERNSTKLYRKQDLNVLYQVCVFRADRKNKMAALASDWLRHFRLLLRNRWTEFNETWTGSKISTSSTKFVFFGLIGKTRWPPWPLICWDIFDFSSETAERNSTKLDRKQDLNVLYQVCVFRADQKNKMAALASDWLRHFRLLLWNRWTEFNETWQEARSQRPLPSLCFSGRSEKQDGHPGLWLAETFSTSPLKPLNGIQRNLTGSKISTSSTKFVFFGLIGKTRWPPWPIRQKGGTLYSGARYVALWASCLKESQICSAKQKHFVIFCATIVWVLHALRDWSVFSTAFIVSQVVVSLAHLHWIYLGEDLRERDKASDTVRPRRSSNPGPRWEVRRSANWATSLLFNVPIHGKLNSISFGAMYNIQ